GFTSPAASPKCSWAWRAERNCGTSARWSPNATSSERSRAAYGGERAVRGARSDRDVERAIRQSGAIERGERVLIACSGGPDSVALASALHALSGPMRLQAWMAYVNHGIRAAAWQDECVAASVAAACGFELDVMRLVPSRGDEASLRELRYAALLECARRRGCTAVVTAHHAEDQSETVLLALF